MQCPRFRADYQPFRLADDTLLIAGERRHLVITERVVAESADLLDGHRSVSDVVAALADRFPLPAVFGAVRRLDALGVLADGATGTSDATAAAWDARGVAPDAAEHWMGHGRVLLVDAGSPAAGALAAGLRALGVSTATASATARRPVPDAVAALAAADPAGRPVVVVAPGNMIDPWLGELNAVLLDHEVSWLLARPHGNVLLLGPHLVPGATGCWECLAQRWAANEQLEAYLASELPGVGRVSTARAALPAAAAALAGLLACELPVLAVGGASPRLTGRMAALDVRDHTLETHELVRQPQCPACGDPDIVLKADPRITPQPAPRTFRDDGGHRVVPPAETFARLARHVSPYLGVVTTLAPLEAYDNGVTYSYGAGHNFAMGTRHVADLRKNLRGQSGGKGRTEIQAKVSAVCEAVERYSGVWRGDRPVHRASYEQLGADRAIHPSEILLFSAAQYAGRDEHNARFGSGFHFVPRPLAPDAVLDWTTGWSLTDDRPRELPAAFTWFGHPDLRRLGFCAADANGCAAGNTLSEAILQGFCELVERDSVALWWYHRSQLPGVDLDSFDDPWLDRMREFYERDLRRGLWVLDATADLGVPAYVGVSHRLDAGAQDVIVGFGAHLDPRTALLRALTEVNQFLPTLVRRNPDGTTRYAINDPESLHWFTTARVQEQPWLCPHPDVPATTATTHPDRSDGDIATAVGTCVELARGAGLEVVVVDQSRPELEVKVARVTVPGLRHFWRRLGPGRLYDVPERLGRTPRGAGEHDLNPYSVFF